MRLAFLPASLLLICAAVSAAQQDKPPRRFCLGKILLKRVTPEELAKNRDRSLVDAYRPRFREIFSDPDFMKADDKYLDLLREYNRESAVRGKYPVFPLSSSRYVGVGEGGARGKVFDLDETYIRSFDDPRLIKLSFKDGKIHRENGELFDTSTASFTGPDDKRQIQTVVTGKAICVMDESGNFYALLHQERDKTHHSSPLEGLPVAWAGELRAGTGVGNELTDSSGHYAIPRMGTANAIGELRKKGMDFSHLQVSLKAPTRVEQQVAQRLGKAGVPTKQLLVEGENLFAAEMYELSGALRNRIYRGEDAAPELKRLKSLFDHLLGTSPPNPDLLEALGQWNSQIRGAVKENPELLTEYLRLFAPVRKLALAILEDPAATLRAREAALNVVAFGGYVAENTGLLLNVAKTASYTHLRVTAIRGLFSTVSNTLEGSVGPTEVARMDRAISALGELYRVGQTVDVSGQVAKEARSSLELVVNHLFFMLRNDRNPAGQRAAARWVLESSALRKLSPVPSALDPSRTHGESLTELRALAKGIRRP